MIFYQNRSILTRQNIYFFSHIKAEKFRTIFFESSEIYESETLTDISAD